MGTYTVRPIDPSWEKNPVFVKVECYYPARDLWVPVGIWDFVHKTVTCCVEWETPEVTLLRLYNPHPWNGKTGEVLQVEASPRKSSLKWLFWIRNRFPSSYLRIRDSRGLQNSRIFRILDGDDYPYPPRCNPYNRLRRWYRLNATQRTYHIY